MKKKHTIYLGIGTNLGERLKNMEQAAELLAKKVGKIQAASSLYETEPWGLTNQNAFVNQVMELVTELEAEEVLKEILQIEEEMGRIRTRKWGERLIDIDLLFYENKEIKLPHLIVPHPYIQERGFVLIPMVEIAADFVHPTLNRTIIQLLNDCTDRTAVNLLYT